MRFSLGISWDSEYKPITNNRLGGRTGYAALLSEEVRRFVSGCTSLKKFGETFLCIANRK